MKFDVLRVKVPVDFELELERNGLTAINTRAFGACESKLCFGLSNYDDGWDSNQSKGSTETSHRQLFIIMEIF
ncbi:hypothetical protein M0802_010025 [Mischocyttarus mexicanus]|nr:hypothetical protein M0802_010025 [Mischocyttarus mexicanus]